MKLAIIVAAAENHVIGRDNGLIWHLSADLKRFKALTTGHAILMGRKTFESMGRALPNRRNVVISGNPGFVAPGAEVVPDIPKALELLKGEERVFVIGGDLQNLRNVEFVDQNPIGKSSRSNPVTYICHSMHKVAFCFLYSL